MLTLPDLFVPGFKVPAQSTRHALWFIFAGQRLWVEDHEARLHLRPTSGWPLSDALPLRQLYMGTWQGLDCFAAEIDRAAKESLPGQWLGLRELWGLLDETLLGLAGQAIQLVDWDRCHQFCGRCGEPTVLRDNERSKHCPACQSNHYPRVAPAVMVRITREDEILMARSPRFVPGMYSVLAGFVDPGETLEQAAHREVMEEVGLEICNLRYFASQSWPFPHSLMIAFTADYAGGEIILEDDEIEDAGWYRRDTMPKIPIKMSIARRLVDDYLAQG